MGQPQYILKFLGAFNFTSASGVRIPLTSKKGIALLALLVTAESGERSRAWLQERLWGSRELKQAQSSLRRELSNLRQIMARYGGITITADTRNIRIDLQNLWVDIRDGAQNGRHAGEFLEGFDIAGEEGFEEWLRETRNLILRDGMMLASGAEPHRWPARTSGRLVPALETPALLYPLDSRTDDDSAMLLGAALTQELGRALWERHVPSVIVPGPSRADHSLPPVQCSRGSPRFVISGTLIPDSSFVRLSFRLFDLRVDDVIWQDSAVLDGRSGFATMSGTVRYLATSLAEKIAASFPHNLATLAGNESVTHIAV